MNMWKQILAGFIVSIPLAPLPAQTPLSNDERAVRAVVQQIADTAHGQDASARDSLFADDAQITNAFGNRAQGREEIDDFGRACSRQACFGLRRTTRRASASVFSRAS
jgi:uncharacterized protein (TIGR02246 family)